MSPVSKRAALGVLTLAGLVLAGLGLWFLSHLGLSGSASFSAQPSSSRIVVLDPSVLNRVDAPVTITAKVKGGSDVWVGRATPSDASSLVGKAATTTVTGVSLSGWQLETGQSGTGAAPALGSTDLWRQQVAAKGSATMTVDQENAPETVVVATASGKPADLTDLTLQWQRPAWSLEAVASLVIGLLLAAAGVVGLVRLRGSAATARPQSPAPRQPGELPTATQRVEQPTIEQPTAAQQVEQPTIEQPTIEQPTATTTEEGRP